MMYMNLPVKRNAYTPEQIERLFYEYGDIKTVAKHLGIHQGSLSRIINNRLSLMEARKSGLARREQEKGNENLRQAQR